MSKKLLVPSFATALKSFASDLAERVSEVKQKAGEVAFDILSGGNTTVDTEKAISKAQGEVGAYEFAYDAVQALLQSFGVDGAIHLVIAGELEAVMLSKPKNVPTLTVITSRNLNLMEGGNAFVQCKEGEFYVQIQSVAITEGNAEVSAEYTYVAKILGTLSAGYIEPKAATTAGRSTARKPAASNKPAKSSGNKASKPAAKSNPTRSRKPRPTAKPEAKKEETASKNAEAASSQGAES
ncbi:hypothetical protein KF4_080 [Vibrio phage vB_VpaS_KF4]|nr:hypothetical protein KF3_046 [Vibrio phage vB_VpaS_KF3]ATI19293.1 hypothetical protein KF4_080 [Vibrio phage vB_VpaS_KF4]